MPGTLRILMCAVMFACWAHLARSQGITINAADLESIYAVGQSIIVHIDTLTTAANIGAPGQTSWDFSSLGTTTLKNLESVPVASTPYAATFPQATYAFRDAAFTYSFFYAALGTTVTLNGTGYAYYAVGSSLLNFGLKGAGNAYLFGNPYPAQGQWVNSPGATDYALPLQFATTWTANYTESISGSANLGAFVVPFGPLNTSHNISCSVDAYGTLTLPGGRVQEALRLRKLDRFSGSSSNGVQVEYVFVAKNGATVEMTTGDTSATSGTISVRSVQWIEGNVTVPITLTSFTGVRVSASIVRLEWKTLSEIDNFGFYVQRKGGEEKEFHDIPGSFVAGHGTTIVPQEYSYVDVTGQGGPWWYRLKQCDLDGTEHFSESVLVESVTGVPESRPLAYALEQNYPNPFNPSTRIQYTVGGTRAQGPGTSNTRLVVYDLLGREVAVLVDERKQPGNYEVSFDASGLASGVYIYRMTAGSFVQSKKMVLLK